VGVWAGSPGGGHVFFANGCAIHGLSSNIDARRQAGARISTSSPCTPTRDGFAVAYPGDMGRPARIIHAPGSNNFFNQLSRGA
jgi:hypothetical protein